MTAAAALLLQSAQGVQTGVHWTKGEDKKPPSPQCSERQYCSLQATFNTSLGLRPSAKQANLTQT